MRHTTPDGGGLSRRRFMALGSAGAALVAAGAAGCASAASTPSASSGRKSSGKGVTGTISFLSWDTLAISQPLVNQFQKAYPNVHVQVEFENPNTYISTLATRLASGTAPDIFIYTAQNKAALNAGDYVLDLTDQDSTKVMAAANRNFMSNGSRVYGFSPASWAACPIWNLQLLDKVGGTPPATWDEFIEVGQKLKALGGVTPYTDAAQLGTILEGLLGSYFKAQGLLAPGQVLGIEADNRIFSGQSTFVKEWMTPLSMYDQLYKEGLIPSSVVSLTSAEIDSELANGQLGALGSGPWDVNSVQQDNPKVALKMLPVPGAKAGEDFWCGAPNQGWAVNAKSPNVDAAVAFVNWLATPAALASYAKLSGDIITTTNYASPVPSSLTEAAQAARDSNYYFTGISWPTKYSELLGDAAIASVDQMIQGQVSPLQVLQAMDAEVQKLRSA